MSNLNNNVGVGGHYTRTPGVEGSASGNIGNIPDTPNYIKGPIANIQVDGVKINHHFILESEISVAGDGKEFEELWKAKDLIGVKGNGQVEVQMANGEIKHCSLNQIKEALRTFAVEAGGKANAVDELRTFSIAADPKKLWNGNRPMNGAHARIPLCFDENGKLRVAIPLGAKPDQVDGTLGNKNDQDRVALFYTSTPPGKTADGKEVQHVTINFGPPVMAWHQGQPNQVPGYREAAVIKNNDGTYTVYLDRRHDEVNTSRALSKLLGVPENKITQIYPDYPMTTTVENNIKASRTFNDFKGHPDLVVRPDEKGYPATYPRNKELYEKKIAVSSSGSKQSPS